MSPDLSTLLSLIVAPILLLVSTLLLVALPPPFPPERVIAILASVTPFLWTVGAIFFPMTVERLVERTAFGPLLIVIFVLLLPPVMILGSLIAAVVKKRWRTVVTFATTLSLIAVTGLTVVLALTLFDMLD